MITFRPGSLTWSLLSAAIIGPACAAPQQPDGAASAGLATHTTEAERGAAPGGAEWFTGDTMVSMLFPPNAQRSFGGASVTFAEGARTHWHTHPAGQTLVVTAGHGWVQLDGAPRMDIHTGDVVWIPARVRHWHGATSSSAMTHIALQGIVDGSMVDWGSPVTDDEFAADAAAGNP